MKSIFHIICYSNTLRININVTVLNYKHLLSQHKLIMCEIHMAQPYFILNPAHIKQNSIPKWSKGIVRISLGIRLDRDQAQPDQTWNQTRQDRYDQKKKDLIF